MNLKRTALAAAFGALAFGVTVSAASAQPMHHPRQAEVLDRAAHQRQMIRHDERIGRLSPAKAHRLEMADRRIAMQDHRMARRNGGYITPAQQHRLNRQENQVARHMPG